MDMAQVLVQNRVSTALPKLPEEVKEAGVTTKKQSTSIVQMIALTSPEGQFDDLYLSNYATLRIKDEIAGSRGSAMSLPSGWGITACGSGWTPNCSRPGGSPPRMSSGRSRSRTSRSPPANWANRRWTKRRTSNMSSTPSAVSRMSRSSRTSSSRPAKAAASRV